MLGVSVQLTTLSYTSDMTTASGTTPRRALETLRRAATDGALDAFCDRHDLDLFIVFGSTADPDVAEPRDLDVAVRCDPTSGAQPDVVTIADELARWLDQDVIDVVDLARADVVLRSRALGPRTVPLLEGTRGAFAIAQMAAMAEEMETAPMRRRDLELLARH